MVRPCKANAGLELVFVEANIAQLRLGVEQLRAYVKFHLASLGRGLRLEVLVPALVDLAF